MGNCCGGPRPEVHDDASVAGTTTSEPTQVSLSKPSHSKKPSTARMSKPSIMTKIAMKFPKIRRSFFMCKQVFEKHAHNEGWVPKRNIKPILMELGAKEEELTEEEIDRLIATANLDGDDKIDFKEFLIAAAIGVFLKDVDENACTEDFKTIRQGFAAVKEAFQQIDVDDSGEIDVEELTDAFLSMRQDELIQERLKELDITGDRQVRFPEFVFGMCAWVGMGDDDEFEEDFRLLSPQVNESPNKTFEEPISGESQQALVSNDN